MAELDEDRRQQMVLPRGHWREAPMAARLEAGSRDPALPQLLVREGAIVQLALVMQFNDERSLDDVTLLVSLDALGHATGTLYEDAGDGYGYERGHYRLTHFEARIEADALIVREAGHEGDWKPPANRSYRVQVVAARASRREERPV